MIYLDTSVILADVFSEDKRPPTSLWDEPLVASRILEYELWTRIHARKLAHSHGSTIQRVLMGIMLIELTPIVLARALEPFSRPVRTLDALHLASLLYLHQGGAAIQLASYDAEMVAVAGDLGIRLYTL